MTAKIIPFSGFTKHDLDPDDILRAAIGELEDTVIVGKDKQGDLYVAASLADLGQLLLRLEAAKKMLIDNFLDD